MKDWEIQKLLCVIWMQGGRVSCERKGYFLSPCPSKCFSMIFTSSKLQWARYQWLHWFRYGFSPTDLPIIPWEPWALLLFFLCSNHTWFSAIHEKKDVAVLAGEQQKQITSRWGSLWGEHRRAKSNREHTWMEKKYWVRRSSVGKGTGSSSRGAMDMLRLKLSLFSPYLSHRRFCFLRALPPFAWIWAGACWCLPPGKQHSSVHSRHPSSLVQLPRSQTLVLRAGNPLHGVDYCKLPACLTQPVDFLLLLWQSQHAMVLFQPCTVYLLCGVSCLYMAYCMMHMAGCVLVLRWVWPGKRMTTNT